MMCAGLVKPAGDEKQTSLGVVLAAGFIQALRAYDRGLRWVLDHQRFTLVITVGTLLLTALLAWIIPKGFFPEQDTGLLVGVSEAAPDVSFARMASLQRKLDEVLMQDPAVATVASSIG